MATAVADPEAASPADTGKGKKKKAGGSGTPWMAILMAVVLSSGISIGASFVLTQKLLAGAAAHAAPADGEHAKPEAAAKKSPPVYVAMDPAFVANLDAAGETRFVQAQVQLMTRDAHGGERIKPHEPRLRNAILLLLSQQHPDDIGSRAGVEKLQGAALAEVQRVLAEETGEPVVEALYFTSFVVQ